MIINPEKYK